MLQEEQPEAARTPSKTTLGAYCIAAIAGLDALWFFISYASGLSALIAGFSLTIGLPILVAGLHYLNLNRIKDKDKRKKSLELMVKLMFAMGFWQIAFFATQTMAMSTGITGTALTLGLLPLMIGLLTVIGVELAVVLNKKFLDGSHASKPSRLAFRAAVFTAAAAWHLLSTFTLPLPLFLGIALQAIMVFASVALVFSAVNWIQHRDDDLYNVFLNQAMIKPEPENTLEQSPHMRFESTVMTIPLDVDLKSPPPMMLNDEDLSETKINPYMRIYTKITTEHSEPSHPPKEYLMIIKDKKTVTLNLEACKQKNAADHAIRAVRDHGIKLDADTQQELKTIINASKNRNKE